MATATIKSLTKERDNLKTEVQELKNQVTSLKNLEIKVSNKDHLVNQVQDLKSQVTNLKNNLETINKSNTDLTLTLKSVEKDKTVLMKKVEKQETAISILTESLKANKENKLEEEFSKIIEKVKKDMKPGQRLLVTRSGTTFANTPVGENRAKYSNEEYRLVSKT